MQGGCSVVVFQTGDCYSNYSIVWQRNIRIRVRHLLAFHFHCHWENWASGPCLNSAILLGSFKSFISFAKIFYPWRSASQNIHSQGRFLFCLLILLTSLFISRCLFHPVRVVDCSCSCGAWNAVPQLPFKELFWYIYHFSRFLAG